MRILYLCTGNAARSLMAEAFTRSLAPAAAGLEAYSAGVDPKGIHPETRVVMQEVGVDMSGYRSKGLSEVPFDSMDLVVTLCDDARSRCPAPPTAARRLHWGLADPAAATGTPEQIRERFRGSRDEVKTCVKRLLFELATDPNRRAGR